MLASAVDLYYAGSGIGQVEGVARTIGWYYRLQGMVDEF
jgi:hypothetical protein